MVFGALIVIDVVGMSLSFSALKPRAVVGRALPVLMLLLTAFSSSAQSPQEASNQKPLTGSERNALAGDMPADPGPRASKLSGNLRKAKVKAAMRKVADWQLKRVEDVYSQDWTFATLDLGLLEASASLGDPRYADYVRQTAAHYDWTLGPRKGHADDHAIGQSYLWLDRMNPDQHHLAAMRTVFEEQMQRADDPSKPVWWWCDALFMAPPAWSGLAEVTHDDRYLAYMDRQWHITAGLLWDEKQHLFSRDARYLDKHERNGEKVFWSRGNGWVMGGLVRLLETLPATDPRRPFYEEKFRQMTEKVRSIQGEDGLWRMGLLDAASYPNAEVSGSAFFVYATAWGISHGVLERKTYLPVVERGWRGLVANVYADGRLGSIQPVGDAPGAYTPGSSYVFGVGAFLLAGGEVEALSR
jgi:rhamnogalacturonyl hydrolase YesR